MGDPLLPWGRYIALRAFFAALTGVLFTALGWPAWGVALLVALNFVVALAFDVGGAWFDRRRARADR